MYLTGVPSADATVLVTFDLSEASEPTSVHHRLFIPPADPDVTMWSVAPPTLDEAKSTYDSDAYESTSAVSATLQQFSSSSSSTGSVLHTLSLTMENPALPAAAQELIGSKTSGFQHSTEYLLTALHLARLTKDEHEISLIREANRISSNAHEVLMKELGKHAKRRGAQGTQNGANGSTAERTGKEGLGEWEVEGEQDAEALFVATCKRMG